MAGESTIGRFGEPIRALGTRLVTHDHPLRVLHGGLPSRRQDWITVIAVLTSC